MIQLKQFNEIELQNILNNIKEKANKTALFENNLRIEFFKKLEKDLNKLKEESENNYIIDFKEINIPSYHNNYFNSRKEQLILRELQKYFYYNITSYTIDNFISNFLYQYKDIEIKNNKIKFNINILDRWGELTPHKLFNFFQFFQIISDIHIPKFEYNFYKQFNDFNKKYSLNDKIDFKIYKNGKIELYIK